MESKPVTLNDVKLDDPCIGTEEEMTRMWDKVIGERNKTMTEQKEKDTVMFNMYRHKKLGCQNIFEESEFNKITEALRGVNLKYYMFDGSCYQLYDGPADTLFNAILPPDACVLSNEDFQKFKNDYIDAPKKEAEEMAAQEKKMQGGYLEKDDSYMKYMKYKAKYLALKSKN